MTDEAPAEAAPAAPLVRQTRLERRISLVWLVPLAAMLLALGLMWRDYSRRGPQIEIRFASAAGVVEGVTRLKHRDVEIGVVEDVGFSPELDTVSVKARLRPEIAPYLNETTQFWIVRPRVSAAGVTGLETVLSGAYIDTAWNGEGTMARRIFEGLSDPPPTPAGTPGLRVRLKAPDGGSVGVGAPVLFKRIPVGRVETKTITPDGSAVEMEVFVRAPHHLRLTQATRFWNASGFGLEFGPEGLQARIDSLSAIVEGGVAFDSFLEMGPPSPTHEGAIFKLYDSERLARESRFDEDDPAEIRVSTEFPGALRGLSAGAPVEHQGLRIGEVTGIEPYTAEDGASVRVRVNLLLQPRRLGLEFADGAASFAFFRKAVDQGLRARLATGSLLTGSRFVELAEVAGAPPAALDMTAEPYPLFPAAAAAGFDSLMASAQGTLSKIDALPFERIGAAAASTLEGASAFANDPALQDLPERVGAIAARVEALPLEEFGAAALKVAEGAQGAIDDARALIADKALQGAPEKLAAALEEARKAAAGAAKLLQAPELQGLPKRVAALPLEKFGAEATRAATGAADLLADPALKAIPARVEAAIKKIEALELESLLASAKASVEAARRILESEGAQKAPEKLAAALDSARALLDDPALRAAAEEGRGALAEARGLIGEIRAAGTVANVNAVLQDIGGAARRLDGAAAGIPALLAQIQAAAAKAENMLADFEPGAPMNYELIQTLKAIQAASGKVYELSSTLQNKPNSIILGK